MQTEVAEDVPQRLAAVVDQFGSTSVSVMSRLIDWFVDLDTEAQAKILGLLPMDPQLDPLREALEFLSRDLDREDDA